MIMKQVILFFLIFCGLSLSTVQAQNYKLNKQVYDYKMYTPQPGDPHNPTVMGVASFFIPGLGQMLSGETGRGLGFLGGTVASGVLAGVGMAQFYDANVNTNSSTVSSEGAGLMIAGALAAAAINIWSIVDAVRVAKVNNMYMQDMRENTGMKIELTPFVDSNNYLGEINASAGLSLKVTF